MKYKHDRSVYFVDVTRVRLVVLVLSLVGVYFFKVDTSHVKTEF